jgi:eukaryotic-like serine/threonine-protein kinase
VTQRVAKPVSVSSQKVGSPGRTVIAVIGVNRYAHWPRLTNAVKDAEGALALFQRLGFEQITEPLFDGEATRDAIQALVTDVLPTKLGSDDSLVLFYAGHGGTRKHLLGADELKTGYLIPVNASKSPDQVSTWVDLDAWLRPVSLLPAKHILVILDSCFSGIALDPIIKWRDFESWKDTPLPTLSARRSRRIITSASDDQVAMDSGPVPGHSLFTGCLIQGLTGGIRGASGQVITGSGLGQYLQQRVGTYPNARQTPDFGTFALDDRGELLIPLVIEQPEAPAAIAVRGRGAAPRRAKEASPALGMADRYSIIELLERRSTTEVFSAVATMGGFTKRVAIKRIDPRFTRDPKFVSSFLDEARLSLHLQHANIVQVFDISRTPDNAYFLVMEHVDGCDLRALIERQKQKGRRLEIAHSIYLMIECCKALYYAHCLEDPETGEPLGIVHRDISPPNITLSKNGEVKLADFGSAKANSRMESTDPGVIKGRFSYLSPEAASELEVDHRADVFAVGVILWELFTGRRLFVGETDYETVQLVRQARVPSVAALNPEVDRELEQIVRKALALDREERYQNANELGGALTRYLFSRRMQVTAQDIANLVKDTQAELERKRSPDPKESLIDALILDELQKMTSLTEEAASGGGTGRPPPPPPPKKMPSSPPPLEIEPLEKMLYVDPTDEHPKRAGLPWLLIGVIALLTFAAVFIANAIR